MDTPKKWVILFVMLLLSMTALLALLNYCVDPFGIFHSILFPRQYQLNERFCKIAHVDKYHHRYDSYIFGNSNAGNTDPRFLERYVAGSRFYNMSFSGGKLKEFVLLMEYFKRKGYEVKNVFVQLALDDNMYGSLYPDSDYLRRNHPHVTNESQISMYLQYLTIFPFQNIAGKIRQSYDWDGLWFDIDTTGMWFKEKNEEWLKRDPLGYVKHGNIFHGSPGGRMNYLHNVEEIRRDFRSLVDICNSRNSNLIVATAPYNHLVLDRLNIDSIMTGLYKLSGVHGIWFCSLYNNITMNDTNYYETAHYRSVVAESTIEAIFSKNKASDFAIFLTPEEDLNKKEMVILNHRQYSELGK